MLLLNSIVEFAFASADTAKIEEHRNEPLSASGSGKMVVDFEEVESLTVHAMAD
jgi:hypothetical protein